MVEARGTERRKGRPPGAPDLAVRERLLLSAAGLFNRKGYSATTVREIVADAGVTKPVLYYYYRNKEGIFLELMREAWGRFDALVGTAADGPGSARTRLLRLAERMLDLVAGHIEVARLIYAVYYGPPQGAPFFDFEPYQQRYQNGIRRMIEEGIRAGEFRKANADDMMWAVVGALNVAVELQICRPESGLGPEGSARVLEVIFRGISAKSEGEAATGRRIRGGRR